MPWSYKDFMNAGGFSEEERKILADYIEFDNNAREKTIPEYANVAQYQSTRTELNRILAKPKEDTPISFINRLLKAEKGESSVSENSLNKNKDPYDTFFDAGMTASSFIRVINQENVLESYLDGAAYGNDGNKKPDPETYFKFAELVKKYFDDGIDVDAQRTRYQRHKEAVRAREERIKAAEEENKQTDKYLDTAYNSYKKGILFRRGSKQYDNIGLAYNSFIEEMIETREKLNELEVNNSRDQRRLTAASLQSALKKLDELKEATKAYYDYKRQDQRKGQWNEDPALIKNSNARHRVMAAKNMDSFADYMKKIYTKKLEDLTASMNKRPEKVKQNADDKRIRISDNKEILPNEPKYESGKIPETRFKISEKEDPEFTRKVGDDRKKIADNLEALEKNSYTNENIDAIRDGISGVIASGLLRSKQDHISGKEYRETKKAYKNEVLSNLRTLSDKNIIDNDDLIGLAKDAFNKEGISLTVKYGKLVKPVINETVRTTSTTMTKKKGGPSI